jgi:glycosyltransferase involved in cell wall biosynthesis
MANRAHVIECVDPRDWSDWFIDFRLPTQTAARLIPSFVYFGTWPAKLSARRADAVQVPARFLQAKVHRLYGLCATPQVVPMPFDVSSTGQKSPSPLVVFVGRLVRRKRPELVIDLARRFPAVRFVIIGGGGGSTYASALRRQAAGLANLTFTDFIDQTVDSRLFDSLSAAWILINNAAREGLPLTFVEAAAHGCAILSASDPDGYASNFGYHVTDGDFVRGMDGLLANENWRLAGKRGQLHVAREHVSADAIKIQLSVYDKALARVATRTAPSVI